jgi:two-component system, LuxR family, response regulator FixJ
MREAQVPVDRRGSVCIVEDDAAVRGSLAVLLRLQDYEAHEFDSAESFLAVDRTVAPACALIDIRLPGMSGLALQARMARHRGSMPVLLMTAQGDSSIARTALLQGAVDFLEKPIDEGELLDAIARALRCDLDRVEHHRERDALLARLATLSVRERDLFERITNGRHPREIAAEFGVSPDALDTQRQRMMEKLRARRIADLFRLRFQRDSPG